MVAPGSSSQEPAGPWVQNLHGFEAAFAEHGPHPLRRVVEDRAVADPLITQLADRPLDPGPGGERTEDGPARRTELEHPVTEALGLGQVVEQPKGKDHVE